MLQKQKYTLLFFLKMLFVPVFFELVIGGGGHYFELGPLTARMLFFSIAIFFSLLYITFTNKINKEVAVLIFAFTVVLFVATFVGFINDAPSNAISEDIKPLSFFYMLLFFTLVVKDFDDIKQIVTIIKVGSVFMAIVYITVLVMLLTGYLDFMTFWLQQTAIGEVFFRNDFAIFYKGFLYLSIGFFFFLLTESRYKVIMLLLVFSALVLSFTRGFILFTIVITTYYIFFINKNKTLKMIFFLLGVFSVTIIVPIFFETLGDKSKSDATRYIQIDQVLSSVTPVTFLIGHGFGQGVPLRPVHMELSFLEIFHKQGIFGVLFWLGFFFYVFWMYFKIESKKNKDIALPFLLSFVFIILQSATNPFMNNPIGLSMMLITVVVFARILHLQKNEF